MSISPRLLIPAAALAATVALPAAAATFTFTSGTDVYTIVEADPFLVDGSAGNTVRIDTPGQFWATGQSSNTDALWHWRNFGGPGPRCRR